MALSKRAIAKAIRTAAKKPTAPVDAAGTTGYDHLIDNVAEAASTRHQNERRKS